MNEELQEALAAAKEYLFNNRARVRELLDDGNRMGMIWRAEDGTLGLYARFDDRYPYGLHPDIDVDLRTLELIY